MAEQKKKPVRVFISYSWSSPTHEAWVLNLATRLREDGVDAILDTQDKFAAAITELDENGIVLVPTFYKGRIYFDFSSDEKFESQYEELLRWILGKPLKIKPDIGSTPRHIEEAGYSIATKSKFQRVLNALREGALNVIGLLKEFSDALVLDLEKLRLFGFNKPDFDDEIIQSIELARPYVEQMIGLSIAIARYSKSEQEIDEFIRLIECIGKFMMQPQSGAYSDWDCDNYKYLCHETFLAKSCNIFKRRAI